MSEEWKVSHVLLVVYSIISNDIKPKQCRAPVEYGENMIVRDADLNLVSYMVYVKTLNSIDLTQDGDRYLLLHTNI